MSGVNALSVLLEVRAPNTFGVGALVSITISGVTQTHLVGVNSNFISHNSTVQYFGLGDAAEVDALRVVWPDGATTDMTNIAANQYLTIQHPDR